MLRQVIPKSLLVYTLSIYLSKLLYSPKSQQRLAKACNINYTIIPKQFRLLL